MPLKDDLYECFEQHLLGLDIEVVSHSEFISTVVASYLKRLQENGGHICLQHEIDLRDEIEAEVVAMLRKKIYGHFNLDQYRQAKRQDKKLQN